MLNVVSGKLSLVVEDELGREVLQLLLLHGSDLQVKSLLGSNVTLLQVALLVEEMVTGRGGRPPLLFHLAKRESGGGILEAVQATADKEVAARIVEILQQQLRFEPDGDGEMGQRVKDWILRFNEQNYYTITTNTNCGQQISVTW